MLNALIQLADVLGIPHPPKPLPKDGKPPVEPTLEQKTLDRILWYFNLNHYLISVDGQPTAIVHSKPSKSVDNVLDDYAKKNNIGRERLSGKWIANEILANR